jgi:hypothetical protein
MMVHETIHDSTIADFLEGCHMPKRIPFLLVLLFVFVLLLLAGCSGEPVDEGIEKNPPAEQNHLEIGTGSTTILVTNGIGDDIVEFSIRESSTQDSPASLLDADVIFKAGQTARLNYSPPKKTEADTADDEKMINQLSDILLKTKRGKTITIYDVALTNLEDIMLCFEDGVGFLRYDDANTSEKVNTKENALAKRAQLDEDQRIATEAETEAAVQTQTPSGAAAQQQWYQPAPTQNTDPIEQVPDQCLDDPVINR